MGYSRELSNCFDKIPHSTIMKRLTALIKCQRTLELIMKTLKAGYIDLENGKVIHSHSGTLQGSVLSPLLCNIVLHELDQFMLSM